MKFVILGTLPGLNEYISAERSNRHSAAKMKKQTEYAIGMIARSQHRKAHFKRPVVMRYLWVEKDRRRDLDNVAFAKKFIQDAFVRAGILEGDGQRHIVGFTDSFSVDPKNPRVEIEIEEISGNEL